MTPSADPGRVGGLPDSGAAARLADLFERHARLVLSVCHGLLRDHHEAEDAAQQTFLSAYGALLGGTEPREPAAWLAAIARNECRLRAHMRMREPLAVLEPEELAGSSDPLRETIRKADVESLRRALASLPNQQRRALVLREFSGLSYGQLAAALRVSEPAVESLLFRARQTLRGSLRAALTPLNAGISVGLSLRDSVARLLAGSEPASAGTLAKLGSLPLAAKVASVTAGAALATVGAVAVAPVSPHPRAHGRALNGAVRPAARPVAHPGAPRRSRLLSAVVPTRRELVASLHREFRSPATHDAREGHERAGRDGETERRDAGSASDREHRLAPRIGAEGQERERRTSTERGLEQRAPAGGEEQEKRTVTAPRSTASAHSQEPASGDSGASRTADDSHDGAEAGATPPESAD